MQHPINWLLWPPLQSVPEFRAVSVYNCIKNTAEQSLKTALDVESSLFSNECVHLYLPYGLLMHVIVEPADLWVTYG